MDSTQELTFTLTIEQANIILASLAKRPYEAVAVVIKIIQEQAQAQLITPAE